MFALKNDSRTCVPGAVPSVTPEITKRGPAATPAPEPTGTAGAGHSVLVAPPRRQMR